MSSQAQYASVPRCGIGQVNAANPNRDGTGMMGTILTAGASGSRIDRVVVQATGTTTAGVVRLFVDTGTNSWLYCELPVAASSSARVFNGTFQAVTTPELFPLVLPAGYSLRASTEKAEAFNIIAVGGDF